MLVTNNYQLNQANNMITSGALFELRFDGTYYELSRGKSLIWTMDRDGKFIELYLRAFIDGLEDGINMKDNK